MDPKLTEALDAIAETNEPLAIVLREIIASQQRLHTDQRDIIAYLVTHIISGTTSTIDLTAIAAMLRN